MIFLDTGYFLALFNPDDDLTHGPSHGQGRLPASNWY